MTNDQSASNNDQLLLGSLNVIEIMQSLLFFYGNLQ